MDAIVTEAGLQQRASFALIDEDPNSRATYASPPCFMHELDPSYLGLTPDRDDGHPAEPGIERDDPT
jgi:hypothetical protein